MKRQEMIEIANIVAQQMSAKVAEEVVKKLRGNLCVSDTEYVDTDEAARILGMSPAYLRAVKDRYPHIKAGNTKQGRIMFRRDSLLNQYNI